MKQPRARAGPARAAGLLALLVTAGLVAGCAGTTSAALPHASRSASPAAPSVGTAGPADAAPSTSPAASPSSTPAARPLAGKVIVLDPGHNGGNGSHPSIIDRMVNIITEWKPCDTAGAETDAGYPEHEFNFNVAVRLARLLRADGAKVILTRHNDDGVGPCVTQRAEIGNRSAGLIERADIHRALNRLCVDRAAPDERAGRHRQSGGEQTPIGHSVSIGLAFGERQAIS